MAAVLGYRGIASYSLPPIWNAPCKQCSKQSTPECPLHDLDCISSHDCAFSDNKYFDSHCLYEQCTADEARKDFLNAFITVCTQKSQVLSKIPQEWIPFLLPPSNSLQSVAAHPTPGPPTGGRPPSSLASTGTTTMTTTSAAPINSMTTTMTQATSVTDNVANPTSTTSWADIHKPICGITEKCLVNKEKNDPCKLENLQCVCKYSNSIARSTYFLPDCLWADCYTDIGRREWLEAFAYACFKANKNITDIPTKWTTYLPSWYPLTPSPSPPSSSSVPTATGASTSATLTPSSPITHLSKGAIAGVSVGSFLAFAFLAICGWAFYRNTKKLKRVSREKAHMADALNRRGVQNRIDELRYGQESDESLNIASGMQLGDGGPVFYKPTTEDVGAHGRGVGQAGEDQEQEHYIPAQPSWEREVNPPYTSSPTPACAYPTRHPSSSSATPPYQYPTRHPSRQEQLQHRGSPDQPLSSSSSAPLNHGVGSGVARHSSRRSHIPTRISLDSLGTTVVTTSPVQGYSVDMRPGAPVYDKNGKKVTYR